MSKLNIKTFNNEVIDRLSEIFTHMGKVLREKGIAMISDEQTGKLDIYCLPFLYGHKPLRFRALAVDDNGGKAAISVHLEDLFYTSCDWLPVEPTEELGDFTDIGIRLAIVNWVDLVLDALADGLLVVQDGEVRARMFKVGDKVRWTDPAIDDFTPEDRVLQESRVYTVYEVDDESYSAKISDRYGEAEVCISELREYHEITFTEPRDCEMYEIHLDDQGTKHIHILGWFWKSGDGQWRLTEPCGLDLPLEEFITRYEEESNYLEELWQETKQYEKDCTPEEAARLASTFFDGVGAEHNIRYGELDPDMPVGNYMHCTSLPRS